MPPKPMLVSNRQAMAMRLMAISVQLSQLALEFSAGSPLVVSTSDLDQLLPEPTTEDVVEFQGQVPQGSTVVEIPTPEDHKDALVELRKKRIARPDF